MGRSINCTDSELSIFLAGLGEDYYPICSSDTCQSEQLRSTPIASKSYQHGKKKVSFPGSRSLMTLPPSTEFRGEGLSTLSQEDFHVLTSHVPEKAPASMESNPVFGGKWQELYVKYDPVTCSWKTHRYLWEEVLPEYSVILPRYGMMLDGVVYQRKTSERPIAGTGSGWLPTPTSSEGACNRTWSPTYCNLHNFVTGKGKQSSKWPTPQAHDCGKGHASRVGRFGTKHGGRNLNDEVAKWPTPTCQDGNGRTHHNQRDGSKTKSLLGLIKSFPTPCATDADKGGRGELLGFVRGTKGYRGPLIPTPTKSDGDGGPGQGPKCQGGENLRTSVGGSLNADWVELLLGWPRGWTSLEPLFSIDEDWFHWPVDWERGVSRVTKSQPNRTKRLKAIGNGQVPICAALAWVILSEIDGES